MLFSIGNIITILIVLTILALYRQFDRNNRSLDKIRRYAEKVTSDLDSFVDSKTQDMKNLAIEIDVHQKAGKEVLKRIKAVEDGFSDKARTIDEINNRINEYDKVLNQLIGMTGKVDENLQRLHQESEFVDKVGKRLKDAQIRVSQLEKNIPELNSKFAVENEKSLEQLRIEVMAGVERQISSIMDNVDRSSDRVDEFSAYMTDLENRRDNAAEEVMSQVDMKLDKVLSDTDEQVKTIMHDFSTTLEGYIESADKKKSDINHQLEASEQKFRTHIDQIGELLNNKLVDFKDNVNTLEEEYQKNLKDAAEKAKKLEDDVFISLKTYIDSKANDARKDITASLESIKKETVVYKNHIESSFGEGQSQIAVWKAKLKKEFDDGAEAASQQFNSFKTEIEAQIQELLAKDQDMSDEVNSRYEKMAQSIENTAASYRKSLDSRLEEVRTGFLASVDDRSTELSSKFNGRMDELISLVGEKEKQLTDFEESLAYKLSRIEDVTSDIDTLEQNLKLMVDKSVDAVNENFTGIQRQMESFWSGSEREIKDQVAQTREVINALEQEINELKTRAYDNVSAGLREFEDGFFDDLRQRSSQMTTQFTEWQESINEKLETLAQEHSAARSSMEAEYVEELAAGVAGLRESTAERFRGYEHQLLEYADTISAKMGSVDELVERSKADIQNQMESGRRESEELIAAEMDKVRDSLNEGMNRVRREAEENLSSVEAAMSAETEKLSESVEARKAELELWQSRLLRQIQDIENGILEQYAGMRSESSERISEIREALSTQRDEFDNVSTDIQKRSREFQNELEQQMRTFEERSSEISENFTLATKRMYEKIDEQTKELSFTVSEIDKQQKSFIAQTKIFERADSMKESLEGGIDALKDEILRVTNQAQEIREAEKKFALIKKQADDISAKMAKFAADKRKIEELDEDFTKLLSISQSVDSKLAQVTTADDSLQLIQAKLRELDGLQSEVEGRYERLKKKESIVDSTIDGVDRSFKQLNELDHLISVIQEKSSPMSSRLDELTRRIDFLSKNKKQIDTAIEQIEGIDTVISDLEDRMDRMQKAREWLAGIETRLEDVNKQAQDQVRLLGTLVKDSASKTRGGGAPPMEIRDVVIKLAHQGWTVEQIARSTKLARGEVELILELQPKK